MQALRKKRTEFALFLKVLLRYLEKTHQTATLRQTRLIVLACIQAHNTQSSNLATIPLQDYIEHHLKRLIDETTWDQVKLYTDYYLQWRERERMRVVVDGINPFDQLVHSQNNDNTELFLPSASTVVEIRAGGCLMTGN